MPTNQPTNQPRESQAELLRCISIFMILLHHFCVHAFYPEIIKMDVIGYNWDSYFVLLTHSFFYIGVNCFLMISGWFGIKPSVRGFAKLYTIYAFYMLLYSLKKLISYYILGHITLSVTAILKLTVPIIFPFSYGGISGMWFMSCYLGIFIMSPILNIAIKTFTKQQFLLILILLTIINIYFGGMLHISSLNKNGYTLMQFIYLYMMGGYLSRHIAKKTIHNNRIYFLFGYLGGGLLWGALTALKVFINIPLWYVFSYNNPLIICMSIGFFLFLMSFQFQSSIINKIAISSLGVYLLNDLVIKYDIFKPYAHIFSPSAQLLLWIGSSFVFYIFAFGIDQLRLIITKPFISKFNSYIDKHSQTINNLLG